MIKGSIHRDSCYEHTIIGHITYYRATVRPCYIGGGVAAQIDGSVLNPEIDPYKYAKLIFDRRKIDPVVMEQSNTQRFKKQKQKNPSQSKSLVFFKSYLKMDRRLKCKT